MPTLTKKEGHPFPAEFLKKISVDSVRIEYTQLKDEFLFEIFAAFCIPLV